MSQLFEQNHFGRLDPLTFGIWCNNDAVTNHPKGNQFATLMIASFWSPPNAGHFDFIKQLDTAEEKGLAYGAFSLFAHENRHFFDLLTTPFGIYLTKEALLLQYTYLINEPEIHNAPAIYFPFSEWKRNAKFLAQLDSDLSKVPSAVGKFAQLVDEYQSNIRNLRFGTKSKQVRPCAIQILEGLAMLSQESNILQYYGKRALRTFRNWARSNPAGNWYYGAIDYIEAELPGVDTDALALLLYLSLFGSPSSTELENASPSKLLVYLVRSVKPLFSPLDPALPKFTHFQMTLELAFREFENRENKRPLHAVRDEWINAKSLIQKLRSSFERRNNKSVLKINRQSMRSPIEELLEYVNEILDLGAKISTQVIFKDAQNLRLSQHSNAIYKLPTPVPFFESTFGFSAFGVLRDAIETLVGFQISSKFHDLPIDVKNTFLGELKENVPSGMPIDFVVIATIKLENVPKYYESALKLFNHLFLCRLATDGLPSFEPFPEYLLGNIWNYKWRVYANGKRIGVPLDTNE